MNCLRCDRRMTEQHISHPSKKYTVGNDVYTCTCGYEEEWNVGRVPPTPRNRAGLNVAEAAVVADLPADLQAIITQRS